MIKDCFTDKTEVFKIESEELIEYNDSEKYKLNLLAQKLSEETGVPKRCIYTGEFNCRIGNWHKINGEYYYFKPFKSIDSFCNELLGELISKYFDLDTVNYKIAKLCVKNQINQYGILSKNFCNKNYTYKNLFDYISENKELKFFEPILKTIEKIKIICNTDEEFVLLHDDLKKMIIRHFYNTQCDGGNGHNIMLMNTPYGIRLAPLFDYEFAYVDYEGMHRHLWDIGELDVTNPDVINIFRNDFRFQELLHKLMNADINSLIDNVESIHKIKMPIKQKKRYEKYEAKVKRLVLENKLIK